MAEETLEQKNARQAEVIERLHEENERLRVQLETVTILAAELGRQLDELRGKK